MQTGFVVPGTPERVFVEWAGFPADEVGGFLKRARVLMTREEVVPERLPGATAVVLDVFMATTTLLAILDNGARDVYPVAGLKEAEEVAADLDAENLLRGGEQDAARIEGYDHGPFPEEYAPGVVENKDVVFVTTNGTRAVADAEPADTVLLGTLRNAPAVARYLEGSQTESIYFVCAGSAGRFTLEDLLERDRGRAQGRGLRPRSGGASPERTHRRPAERRAKGRPVPLGRLEPDVFAEDRRLGGRAQAPPTGPRPAEGARHGTRIEHPFQARRRLPAGPETLLLLRRRFGDRGSLLRDGTQDGGRARRGLSRRHHARQTVVPRHLAHRRGHARQAARGGREEGRVRGSGQARGVFAAADGSLDLTLRQGEDGGDGGGRAPHGLALAGRAPEPTSHRHPQRLQAKQPRPEPGGPHGGAGRSRLGDGHRRRPALRPRRLADVLDRTRRSGRPEGRHAHRDGDARLYDPKGVYRPLREPERARPLGHALVRGLRLLQAGRDTAADLRPVEERPDGGRALRRLRPARADPDPARGKPDPYRQDLMERIAVLGTGTMGAGIVQLAAQSGHRVIACDTSVDALERAH